ncbi:MAG: hypothetical protein N2484_06755 [Clostridia bacterium]|nr:hypothetical protein [Clostridia bacterium]
MEIRKSRTAAIMTLLLSILALYASLAGVLDKNIYQDVLKAGTISHFLLVGSIAQDIIFIPLSIILAILSIVFLIRPGLQSLIAIIGLAWCFFYGYGLYVIQGQYTSIYIIYLSIFGLSIYSMIWGFLSFKPEAAAQTQLPRALRISIGVFFIFILCVLVPGWLLRMTPDIAKHIPDDTYAVFIMDLCLVFPALAQIAVMLFRRKPWANILAGVALIKALALCLSWAFSQWFSPFYAGFEFDYGMTAISTILTVVSFALLIPYMLKLKKGESIHG